MPGSEGPERPCDRRIVLVTRLRLVTHGLEAPPRCTRQRTGTSCSEKGRERRAAEPQEQRVTRRSLVTRELPGNEREGGGAAGAGRYQAEPGNEKDEPGNEKDQPGNEGELGGEGDCVITLVSVRSIPKNTVNANQHKHQ